MPHGATIPAPPFKAGTPTHISFLFLLLDAILVVVDVDRMERFTMKVPPVIR